jgi:two-component system sensor histidine kinase UhpB
MSLFWRVFFVNAALLIAGVLVLALTPISVSAQIRLIQAIVLAVGVVIVLVANLILLRPLFAPLERLARRMEELDVLRVLQPVPANSPGEIGALERAFNRMIERLEAERRQAGTRALQAREEERQRIARGLHDEVGQTMTGILLLLKQLTQSAPDSQRAPLDEAQQAIRTNLDEVRRIAQELRPEALDHLGLASAVNNRARAFERRTNVKVERRIDPNLGTLGPNVELVLYRVAQESLTTSLATAGPRRSCSTCRATAAASSCEWPTTAAASSNRTSRAAGCAGFARTPSSSAAHSRSSRAQLAGSRSASRSLRRCRSHS